MVQIHALGGVTVTHDGVEVNVGGPRLRRLLAVLLINRNTVVSVDSLADAVFAGAPTPAAPTTLRSYVARIRRVIEIDGDGPVVVTQPPGYLLRVDDAAFDIARFEASVADARALLSQGQPAEAVPVLRNALAMWRGEAYVEFSDEDWAWPESQRLAELRLVAHEVLFDAQLEAGRASDMIPEVEAMATQHPLRETFVAQLLTALYRAGRQADALRAYRQHRDVLVEELGLDPTPAMQDLEQRVVMNDPGLLAAESGRALRGYRLRERLGTGRDGTVHAAALPGVERDLVVRVYRSDVADTPEFVRSFEANAHLVASLRHRAVVAIHDYWREPGAAYLVMRRMRGGSLADRLERRDRRPLGADQAADICRRLEEALAAAHDAGVVHGRITPGNVLFDESGQAFLSDFDLCGGADQSADRDALRALVRDCLGSAPGLEVRPASGASRANPYKGLRAFDEADADDFYGRKHLVEQLVGRIQRDDLRGRLVLVVGGSGTGKSSVVQAGLLPRVRRGDIPGSDRWFVTTMLPGGTPFKELAAALRRVAVVEDEGVVDELAECGGVDRVVRRVLPGDGQLLLVVDQFEELFTSAPEADQRRFLDGVMQAVTAHDSRVRVVATMRADFYDRPLAFQSFGQAVSDATVTVPAMSAAELESAIVDPAARVGRKVEGALLAELVSAAVGEPASLPSLQFTLFELGERCTGDLTVDAYRALGGLTGAIASRAEALYRSLDDDEQAGVRRLFEQLVVVNSDGEPTRRRATRAEATADDPALDPLIDRWADARLLSLDRHRQSRLPTVEPAHEALLREWPRLRNWINEDRDALLVLGHLREAAASWIALDRDGGALYRGARLQAALDMLPNAALGAQERQFLEASVEARAAEQAEAAEAVQRTVRSNRRLRRQLIVIGGALVVALVAALIAVDQRQEAEEERRVAFARELAAAAGSSIEEDPERAILLALAAIEGTGGPDGSPLPEAVDALHQAVSRSRVVLDVPGLGGALSWSPDGSVFVTEGPEDTGLVDLRDAGSGRSVRSWVGHEVDINDVVFSEDGTMVATSGDDGAVRVWDTGTAEELAEFLPRGAANATAPAFSPDGSRIAFHLWDFSMTMVFDLRTGDLVREEEQIEGVHDLEFSPDGRRLLLGSADLAGVNVLDLESGQISSWGGDTDSTREVRFSPDGRLVASAHLDGAVRVWDARTGEPQLSTFAHGSEVYSLDWSPDGSMLASGSQDGTARIHIVTTEALREVLRLSARDLANGVSGVEFSPDGSRLMTADGRLASVKVWDTSEQGGAEWANIESLPTGLTSDDFLPDGSLIVMDEPGVFSRFAVARGERLDRFDLGVTAEVLGLWWVVSPDGDMLVTDVNAEGNVVFWDRRTGGAVFERKFDRFQSGALAWSPDSEFVAVAHDGSRGAMVTILDRSGDEVGRLTEAEGTSIVEMEFTADGDRLVTSREPPRITPDQTGIRVWEWRTGEVVTDIGGIYEQIAVDPRGRRVAAVSVLSSDVDVFDLDTGEEVFSVRGSGGARDASYSADGSELAVPGADGSIRIWDAQTGRQVTTLRSTDRAVIGAVFSPDGRKLASQDEDGLIRIWALDVGDLVSIAQDRLTRQLTDAECRQYLRRETCDDR